MSSLELVARLCTQPKAGIDALVITLRGKQLAYSVEEAGSVLVD